MAEIINITELSQIIAAAPVTNDHSGLLNALAARYPSTPFKLLQECEGRTWNVGIIDSEGNRVTDSIGKWVDQELASAGGDARAVWERHKNEGLIRTERVGSALYLTAPFGSDPDAFWQLEVECGPELTTQQLFDPKEPAEDRFDLLSGPCFVFGDEERKVLAPPAYNLEALTNIKTFLRRLVEADRANRLAELPELEKKAIHQTTITHIEKVGVGCWDFEQEEQVIPFLDLCPGWASRLAPAYRLFQDWQESSAGREGRKICDHWWMQTNEWTDQKGKRQYSLIPQWSQTDGGLDLPEISPDWEDSPYGVMEAVQQFDRRVGYPMAWYFYALHGNRISHSAAGIIANAIKGGLLHLPEHDEKVLLRWREQQYGF